MNDDLEALDIASQIIHAVAGDPAHTREAAEHIARLCAERRAAALEQAAQLVDEHPDDENCQGDPELVRGCCEVIAGRIRALVHNKVSGQE